MKRIILTILVIMPLFVSGQYYNDILKKPIQYNTGLLGVNDGIINSNVLYSYTQSAEGEDLVSSKNDSIIPYVSGFGVNQIFDFSSLQDTNFNKNAYDGNSYSLPEHYNYPYVNIYYDASNPYHWKIKDFHYRNYESQADDLTNIAFGKLIYDGKGYGLTCTTAGIAYTENTYAYGVWEFGLMQNTTFKNIIISNNTSGGTAFNGYYLIVGSGENIALVRASTGSSSALFNTASGYIDEDVCYGIKIERNSTVDEYHTGAVGSFKVYIRGGSFGDSYVAITPSSGSNPVVNNTYTTSAYTVLDFAAEDGIRDYYINDELQNTKLFTQSTGVYTIDELQSANEVIIFNESQTGSDLDLIKNCIGLIPGTDYYQNETQP